jgi:hypothetical protein
LEAFIDLLEKTSTTVATVTAGDRDFATPDGRFMARIEGTIARRESEHKSERIKRKHQELADDGVYAAGANRPFGYEWVRSPEGKRVGLKVVPSEKRQVVEAARRVLAGESLRSICIDWTSRGVPTVNGGRWNTRTLSQILTAGRIAGWRDRHGEPLVHSDKWTPLVDEKTWRQLRTILLDPARKRTRVARSYLLGQGVLRCGTCGGQLVARPRYRHDELVPWYGCVRDRGGCGGVACPAEPVEQIVSDAVVQALSDRKFLARLRGADEGDEGEQYRAEIAEMEAALEQASKDYYAEKMLTRAEFVAARDALVPRLDAAKAAQAASTRRQPSALLDGLDDLKAKWDGLGLDRRRALIELCIESVSIAPSAKARNVAGYFDADRVQSPVWRV